MEKAQKRVERKTNPKDSTEEELVVLTGPRLLPEFMDDLPEPEADSAKV
jgi:hypothetical protein